MERFVTLLITGALGHAVRWYQKTYRNPQDIGKESAAEFRAAIEPKVPGGRRLLTPGNLGRLRKLAKEAVQAGHAVENSLSPTAYAALLPEGTGVGSRPLLPGEYAYEVFQTIVYQGGRQRHRVLLYSDRPLSRRSIVDRMRDANFDDLSGSDLINRKIQMMGRTARSSYTVGSVYTAE